MSAAGHSQVTWKLWIEATDSGSGVPRLVGHITNVVAAPLDPKTLEPAPAGLVRLADIQLTTSTAQTGAWSGPTAITATSTAPAGFPAPDAFVGDWHAAVYGPDTTEITGRLRLWTPLPPGADPSTDWPPPSGPSSWLRRNTNHSNTTMNTHPRRTPMNAETRAPSRHLLPLLAITLIATLVGVPAPDTSFPTPFSPSPASAQTTIDISISGGSAVTEGTAAEFTVTASTAPTANLTVNLTVADATGSDFVASGDEGAQTVTITANMTTATHSVPTTADTTDEPDGDVTVTVAAGTGYSVGATSSATVTVNDDDGVPTVPAGCTAFGSPTSNLIKTVTSTATTVTVTFGSATNRMGGGILSICEPGASGTYSTRDAQTWEFEVAPLEDDTFEITGLTAGTDYWVQYTVYDSDSAWHHIATSSAVVDGTTLVLTFSESLDGDSVPVNSAFDVQKTEAGAPHSVSVSLTGTPSISGRTVTLTLASAVVFGDTVTVSYTKPDSNPLQYAADNQVESFTQRAVTNNTVPAISSAWVSGSSLTIAFDVSLAAAANLENSAFTVKVGGSEVSLSATEGPSVSLQMVTLTLTSAVSSTTTHTVTVSYSQPTTGTDNLLRGENTSGAAGRVASFTDQAVGTPPNFVSATVNGTTLTVTFDENLDTSSLPAGSSFSLWAGGAVVGLGTGTASISDMTATVTLDAAVAAGESVILNYINPTETPLQDAAGNDVPSFYFKPVTNNTTAVDTTAPTLVGGAIRESTVRLYFNEPMDTAATLTAAGITLTSSSSLGAVSNPTWNASEPNILTLTTATAADTTQAVQVSIAASAGVQDAAGNALAAVTNFELTNIGGFDPGAPALSTVEVDGDTLTLTYNQRLLPRYPPPGDFTVSATGTTTTVNSLAINPGASTSTVVLMLSTPVKSSDTVTLSYSKASAPRLQNPWGIQVAVLTSEAVTNNTAAPVSTTPPARIWSSWLTVFVLHGVGCATPSPNADPLGLPPLESEYEFACIRRLTDYSFMHEGVRYEFGWVAYQGSSEGDEHFAVGFNPIDDGSIPLLSQEWTLHVDNTKFPVADSSLEVENLEGVNIWTNPGLDWEEGQRVWLCLTTGGASCVKPATPAIPAPDNTAPVFSSAVVDRATLTVTFNEALDENSGAPDRSAFDVTVAGSRRNVASDILDGDAVAIDGKTVTLGLESAVAGGQIVTLAYTKPTTQGGSPLRDPFLNNVQGFSGKSVTNATKPWLPDLVVSGVKLTLIFDQELDPSSEPASGDFEVKVNGQVQNLADPVDVRDTRLVLTLLASVGAGDRVTLSYPSSASGASTPILGADGTEAASFKDRSVRNLASDRTAPSLRAVTVDTTDGPTNKLVLTYNERLDPDGSLPLPGDFKVDRGDSRIIVSSIEVSGTRVELTLNSAVAEGDKLEVNFLGGTLRDYAGNPVAGFTRRTVTHGPPPADRPPTGSGTRSGGGRAPSGGGGGSDPVPEARVRFVDDDNSVHHDAIERIAAAGITVGCSTEPRRYCPDRPVTRAQMASFLARALKLAAAAAPAGFTDVNDTSVHADAIERIAAAGITAGCSTEPRRYCPDRPVTRAEMASFLARALNLPAAAAPAGFTDVNDTSVHADAIERIAAAGITADCSTQPRRYCPDKPVTRAQMASFLARRLNLPAP